MVSDNPPLKEQNDMEQDGPIGTEIEFEPLEETFPDEEDTFSEMFHRLERNRSLGYDESFY